MQVTPTSSTPQLKTVNGQTLLGTGNIATAPVWRGARVRKSVAQSIPANGSAVVTFELTDVDTDGLAETANRLTVKTGDTRIRLRACVRFGYTTAYTSAYFRRNGSIYEPGSCISEAAGSASHVLVSGVLDVYPDDYWELVFYTQSGTGSTIAAAAETWFEMEVLE